MKFLFILTFLFISALSDDCNPPIVDLLWVLDGTLNVGSVNHAKMKDFVTSFVKKMNIGVQDSRVGLVQFTPTARPDFYPLMHLTKTRVLNAVNNVPYKPCTGTPQQCFALTNQTSTLNYVAQFGLSPLAGNRPQLPDVIVILTTDSYSETNLRLNSTKYDHVSLLYVFPIRIGNSDKKLNLDIPKAASIDELRTNDFDSLNDLVEPLCEKMVAIVDGSSGGRNGNNGEGVTKAGIFGYGWMILILLIVLFLIFLCMLCCCLLKSNKENDELKTKLHQSLDNKLKWAVTRDSRDNGIQVGSAKAQMVMANGTVAHDQTQRAGGPIEKTSLEEFDFNSDSMEKGRMSHDQQANKQSQTDLKGATLGHFDVSRGVPQIRRPDQDKESHSDSEAMSVIMSRSRISTLSNLPDDHPARGMIPFDMLFVVDNSGSIGMANFKKVKTFLQDLIDNIDVAPGRSRVAVEIFNVEPELYFSFDKYFSATAVRIAIQKMPYGGGGTFLGRALLFASGILSQNTDVHPAAPKPKNNKRGKPVQPRRKRLQILCVLSDGLSEDNVEQGTRSLHDKLDVKVCAVGVRSFHKDRLKTVTHYDGSIFLLNDVEALSNWIFRQQSHFREQHGGGNLLAVPEHY